MEEYLSNYSDLWQIYEGDVDLRIIDDDDLPEDYYGWNLTGDYRMVSLFFTGTSDFFPGILIGNDDHDNDLEECPIYLCDISSNEEPKYMGNFKEYMTYALNRLKNDINRDNYEDECCLSEDMTYDDFCNSVDNAFNDLISFSDNILVHNYEFTRDVVQIDNDNGNYVSSESSTDSWDE